MGSVPDNSKRQQGRDIEVNAHAVQSELARILASEPFSKAERMARFLRFVTEATLDGSAADLKEVVIGANVFDRPPDYDPKTDPVVRNEARRLRAKLDEYYRGPGARDSVHIEVPKGAYVPRFIRVAPAAGPILLPVEVQRPIAKRPPRWAMAAVSILVIAGIGAVALLLLNRNGDDASFSIQPVTALPGDKTMPAISPGAQQIAFVWDGDTGNQDIYVTMLHDPAAKPLRLTTDPGQDLYPEWSPDGSRIAFTRVTGFNRAYYVVPALGGAERLLLRDMSRGGGRPAWLPDGKSLVISQHDTIEAPNRLVWITADGSQRRQITFPPPGADDHLATISGDGREVAFVRSTGVDIADIYIQRLDSRDPKRLTFDGRGISGLTWAGASNLIYAANRDGGWRLRKIAAAGGTPQPVLPAVRGAQEPFYSQAGSRLVYSEVHTNTNIWRAQITDGRLGRPQRLIASSTHNDSPQYSPDGKRIAFLSDRAGSWEIWISDADGGSPGPLTSFNGGVTGTARWSPNGRELAFDSTQKGRTYIYRISANGGTPTMLTPDGMEGMTPSWSQDGQSIYFASFKTGTWEVWKQPAAGGPAVQVTTHGGIEALESPDGGSLLFVKAREPGIWNMSVHGGPEAVLPGTNDTQRSRYLAVTTRGVFYLCAALHDSAPAVCFLPNGSRTPQTLGMLERPSVWGTPSLTVAPDGSNIVYAQTDHDGSDIVMVEGLRER
jgi:Tol biopolymer transport system component